MKINVNAKSLNGPSNVVLLLLLLSLIFRGEMWPVSLWDSSKANANV